MSFPQLWKEDVIQIRERLALAEEALKTAKTNLELSQKSSSSSVKHNVHVQKLHTAQERVDEILLVMGQRNIPHH